jgi:hypothetical protein
MWQLRPNQATLAYIRDEIWWWPISSVLLNVDNTFGCITILDYQNMTMFNKGDAETKVLDIQFYPSNYKKYSST